MWANEEMNGNSRPERGLSAIQFGDDTLDSDASAEAAADAVGAAV